MATIQPPITAKNQGRDGVGGLGLGRSPRISRSLRTPGRRGDGSGFTLPAYDSTSGYTDTESLPATPKKWTYRVDDHGVGQWSNPVNLTVGG